MQNEVTHHEKVKCWQRGEDLIDKAVKSGLQVSFPVFTRHQSIVLESLLCVFGCRLDRILRNRLAGWAVLRRWLGSVGCCHRTLSSTWYSFHAHRGCIWLVPRSSKV